MEWSNNNSVESPSMAISCNSLASELQLMTSDALSPTKHTTSRLLPRANTLVSTISSVKRVTLLSVHANPFYFTP